MANITYEIQLTGLVNGVTAKPREIAWVQQTDTCLDSPCTYDPIKNTITVTLLEGCEGTACIEGWVIFGDECTNCEPIHFKKCFCTDKTQCSECEDCNSLGVCQSLCAIDEFCVNDDCVQCDETHPCTGGRICLYGNCVCPQGTHWNGVKCIECDETTILTACEQCINGVIVAVQCAGGCDPIKGCVDCVNDTDCSTRTDGKNCCNGNNECTCCPGFIWDPIQRKCIVAPCPPEGAAPCKRCTDDGWVDVLCPEGYECIPDVDDCVYSPCGNKECHNAFDCVAEDCGCPDTTKICTDCDDDPTGRGCEPNNCENVTCTAFECGEDCGCYQGGCVPCSWLTPEEQAATPGCNGTSLCKDTFDAKIVGCNLESTLVTSQPCACPILMGSLTNGLVVPTVTNSGTNINTVTLKSDFKYQLRKGLAADYQGFLSLPLLSDTSNANIAHNEKPSSGIVTLNLVGTYKSETAVGVLANPTTVTLATVNTSIANLSEVTFANVSFKSVEMLPAGISSGPQPGQPRPLYKFLTNITITVSYTNLIFPNTCNYGTAEIFKKDFAATSFNPDPNTFSTIYNTNLSLDKLQTSGTRSPLFVYKRSKTANFTNNDIFRKVYVPKINGVYKDVLYGPGCVTDPGKFPLVTPEFGLYSGYNYLVSNDCGCELAKTKLIQPLVICENTTPVVVLTECNTKVTINPIIPTCPINKRLSTLLVGCSYPTDAQVYYNVYINGVFEVALLPEEVSNFVKTVPAGITSVRITHSHDESCVLFEQTYTSAEKDPTYTIDCKLGNYADIVFSQVVAPGVTIVKATNLSNFNEYLLVSGVVRIVNVTKGSTINVKVEFSDGCIQTIPVLVDCCASLTLSASLNNNGKICNSVPVEVTLTSANGYGALEYYINDVQLAGTTYTATTLGEYTAKVIDANGCEKEVDFVVGECTDVVISNIPVLICTGQNSTLRIEGDPNATVILQYPNLTSATITLDANGVWEQTVSTDGVYEILTYNGVAMTGITSELNVVSTPSLSSITAPSSACKDTSVSFTFTGTAGALITVNFGFGSPVNLTIGGGGTVTHTIVYPNSGSFTVDVTEISVGGSCANDPGVTHAITIVEKPTILIGATTCDLVGNTAATAITVSPTGASLSIITGTGTISGTLGNYFLNTDTSETALIRATNGTCTTDATIIVSCNCPSIIAPNLGLGEVCASYNYAFNTYMYSITGTNYPGIITNYSGTFTAKAIYNGNDYPMSTDTQSAWITALPFDYNILNPTFHIEITDVVTGCVDTVDLTPFIITTPIVSISGPTLLCVDSPNIFTSTSSGYSAGYDYLWTVLKNGVPLAVTGNTSSTFVLTPTTYLANYEVKLTRSTGIACSTTSNTWSGVSESCCPWMNIGTTSGWGDGCNDLVFSVLGGTAPYEWEYAPHPTLGGSLTANDTGVVGNTLTIDTDQEYADANGQYRIVVTDVNGCTKEFNTPYRRCPCICSGSTCSSNQIAAGHNHEGVLLVSGLYGAGRQLQFTTLTNTPTTSASDRYRIYVHNGVSSTLIVDTGYVYVINDAGCPVTNGYPLVNLSLLSNGSIITGSLPVALVPITLIDKNSGTLRFNYTTNAGDWIEIIHNDPLCSVQGYNSAELDCLDY